MRIELLLLECKLFEFLIGVINELSLLIVFLFKFSLEVSVEILVLDFPFAKFLSEDNLTEEEWEEEGRVDVGMLLFNFDLMIDRVLDTFSCASLSNLDCNSS